MKEFRCGDVVPGCTAAFRGPDEETILQQVGQHARNDHGMTDIPASLLDSVRSCIVDVPAA